MTYINVVEAGKLFLFVFVRLFVRLFHHCFDIYVSSFYLDSRDCMTQNGSQSLVEMKIRKVVRNLPQVHLRPLAILE